MVLLGGLFKQASYTEVSFEVVSDLFRRVEETLQMYEHTTGEKKEKIEKVVKRLISHSERDPLTSTKLTPIPKRTGLL